MNKTTYKSAIIVLASLFLVTVGFGKTYRIGMIHWIAYSPLNVAQELGYWEEQGIDVEVINFGSNQELNTALENKRIDIALDMLGSWVGMITEGVPLTLIGETDWSNGGDKIIAKKEMDLGALKGETIGVYLDKPSVTYFLDHYLNSIGLKVSDINIVEVEPESMSDNFISGRFQVIVNYDPQALRAEREGDGKVAATSASYPGCIPEGFVAHTEVLQTIPEEDLSKIFEGWIKAVKWMSQDANWERLKSILNAKTFEGEDAYSESDLREMLNSVKIHNASEQLDRNTSDSGLKDYLVKLKAFMTENGMLDQDFDVATIMKTDVLADTLKAHQ